MKTLTLYLVLFALSFSALVADENKLLLIVNQKDQQEAVEDWMKEQQFSLSDQVIYSIKAGAFVSEDGTQVPLKSFKNVNTLGLKKTFIKLKREYKVDALVYVDLSLVDAPIEYMGINMTKTTLKGGFYLWSLKTGESMGKLLFASKKISKIGKDDDEKKELLLKNAFSKLSKKDIKKFVEKFQKKSKASSQLVSKTVIRFKDVSMKTYVQNHHDIKKALMAITSAQSIDLDYDDDRERLVAKFRTDKDAKVLQLALAEACLRGEVAFLGQYKVAMNDEGNFLLSKLSTKKMVFFGVTQANVHDRLSVLKKLIASQKGISNVTHKFFSPTARISSVSAKINHGPFVVFSFNYADGLEDLSPLMWKTLQAKSELKKLKFVSVSSDRLVYYSPLEANELKKVTVVVSCLLPEMYRKMGVPFDTIIKGFKWQDLAKTYDPKRSQLSYSFNTKKTALAIETSLWAAITENAAFNTIVQDCTIGQVIGFAYSEKIDENSQLRVDLKGLSGEAYKQAGVDFVKVLESSPFVASVLKKSYDKKSLTMTVILQGVDLKPAKLDGFIWPVVRKYPSLNLLGLDTLSEKGPLVYSLSKAASVGRLTVVIHRVGYSAYTQLQTSMQGVLQPIAQIKPGAVNYYAETKTLYYNLSNTFASVDEAKDKIEASLSGVIGANYTLSSRTVGGRIDYYYQGETPVTKKSGAKVTGQLLDQLDDVVVKVRSDKGEGTGVLVSKSGHLLTSYSLVSSGGAISIVTYDGRFFKANVVKVDKSFDLALLQVQVGRYPFKSSVVGDSVSVKKGGSIFTLSAPSDGSTDNNLLRGSISSLKQAKGFYKIVTAGSTGNAGSPVFDFSGRLIGLVVATNKTAEGKIILSGNADEVIAESGRLEDFKGLVVPIHFAKSLLNLIK